MRNILAGTRAGDAAAEQPGGLRPDQLAALEDGESGPKQAPLEDGQLVSEPDHGHVSGASQAGSLVGNAAAAAAIRARLTGPPSKPYIEIATPYDRKGCAADSHAREAVLRTANA